MCYNLVEHMGFAPLFFAANEMCVYHTLHPTQTLSLVLIGIGISKAVTQFFTLPRGVCNHLAELDYYLGKGTNKSGKLVLTSDVRLGVYHRLVSPFFSHNSTNPLVAGLTLV